ncbi:UNVERIFIED_CONTAM: hypothetical protein PYX00_002993 [Menopon gallinae]|uniref:BCD1 alpha/beta domain-containing protein n=1 Tax=Menopon gallinae TaxID=328185 RepID=A0AAW2HYM3_9NEOP
MEEDVTHIHKKELECNGERDKTGYVPLSKFTNLTLLSDYRFLEDVSRAIDNCKRNPMKKCTRFKRPLPPHLWRLRTSALKRKTTVHFLPQHFTRHKENTTHLNFKSGVIYWKLELIFPQGDNVKINLEKCCEEDRLSSVLSQLLDYEKCPDLYKNHLKFYHACGMSGIEVLLKAENVKCTGSFFLLDLSLTLKENFEKMVLVEHPILYVILRDHKDEYTILDPDLDIHWNSNMNGFDAKNFAPFHYFDAISYTNDKMSKSDQAAQSISSSVAELKKYFAAGDSDESDNEGNECENGDVSSQGQGSTRGQIHIPHYEDLIKKVENM